MAEIIIIISVISIILLTAVEIITVTVSRRGEFIIKFDFLFMMLILYPERGKNEKKKSKGKKKSNRGLIYDTILYALGRSDVALNSLCVPIISEDVFFYPFNFGAASAIASALLSFIKSKARSFTLPDNSLFIGSGAKIEFDVSLRIMLFDLISAYIFYRKKKRFFKKNVGQQNE